MVQRGKMPFKYCFSYNVRLLSLFFAKVLCNYFGYTTEAIVLMPVMKYPATVFKKKKKHYVKHTCALSLIAFVAFP